jgi:two-component system cell cycle response regulator
MTARVLVVDDIPANVKLLEARLKAEYFEVLTASNGPAALDICGRDGVDVVLLDVMMPGMDGFDVCRRLKANPRTRLIPVVMVTALDQPSDRIHGFEAGADDFLTKPVNDVALVTRVKNLARTKQLADELVMRVTKSDQASAAPDFVNDLAASGTAASLLLIDDQKNSALRLSELLATEHKVQVANSLAGARELIDRDSFDVVIISLALDSMDALRVCSVIRTHAATRHLPILALGEVGDTARMLRALELGVNDYIERPVDRIELLVRVRSQVRRRRFSEYLLRKLDERVEQAARDPLTGMYNRRHMEERLDGLLAEAASSGGERELSIILADIDHFKAVNDTYGHDSGDEVIRQFSTRILHNIRRVDLAFRIGGEEFVVILPKTGKDKASKVGERLRAVIEGSPFRIGGGARSIKVTTSIGLTSLKPGADSLDTLLKRADEALYEAKDSCRNRVVCRAA